MPFRGKKFVCAGSTQATLLAAAAAGAIATLSVHGIAASATAAFVGADTTTRGTWRGVYGANGYSIANDATSLPAYAQVAMSGQGSWTWAASTADTRALQRATGTDRSASTFYGWTTFTIDIRLTD